MNCEHVQQELLKSLETEHPVRETVRHHLNQCRACAEFRSTLEFVVPEDMPAPSPGLDASVLDLAAKKCRDRQCRDAPNHRRFRGMSFRMVRWAAAAAAALVLVAASYQILVSTDRTAPEQARGGAAANSTGGAYVLGNETLDSLETELLMIEAQLTALTMMNAGSEDAGPVAVPRGDDDLEAEALLELEAQLLYLEEAI